MKAAREAELQREEDGEAFDNDFETQGKELIRSSQQIKLTAKV